MALFYPEVFMKFKYCGFYKNDPEVLPHDELEKHPNAVVDGVGHHVAPRVPDKIQLHVLAPAVPVAVNFRQLVLR